MISCGMQEIGKSITSIMSYSQFTFRFYSVINCRFVHNWTWNNFKICEV